jgi:ABC-2 type transport system permease protein
MTTVTAAKSSAAINNQAGTIQSYPLRDVITLLRRNIKNQLRDPVSILTSILIPVIFLLLFVYVFGGALGKATVSFGATRYVDFVLPGLILMTATAGVISAATGTAVDMTEGFITRLRTMPVFSHAILLAKAISYLIQTLLSMALVFGVAIAMGLSLPGNPLRWLAIVGFLTFVSLAFTWLGLAFGLAAKTVASASNGPFPLLVLPLVGNGIVPTQTMSTGVRYFAEYQPFSPMITTLRGLLLGTPMGDAAYAGLAWVTGIGILGFLWSMKAFKRDRPS